MGGELSAGFEKQLLIEIGFKDSYITWFEHRKSTNTNEQIQAAAGMFSFSIEIWGF